MSTCPCWFPQVRRGSQYKPCDLLLSPSHVTIKILKSKTDQLRQGNEVVIARTGSETCPVSMLEKYITRAKINLSSELYLFRPIVSSKVQRLHDTGQLTYSRLRELLKTKLEELGYPSTEFGVHSPRAGGATAASGGVFQTDFLRSMATGIQKPPKMVILRTLWNNVSYYRVDRPLNTRYLLQNLLAATCVCMFSLLGQPSLSL